MRIIVDFELCEGNAMCEDIAPEVFQVGDDDQVHLLVTEPGSELARTLELAVQRCPKQALILER